MASGNGVDPHIEVRDLTMAYGSFVLMRDLTFDVNRGDIFFIIGGSGSGKSTMLRHMLGLKAAAKGEIRIDDHLVTTEPERMRDLLQRYGVLYQSGALWSALTLQENIAVPLQEFTELDQAEILRIASLKLALVGLAGFEDYYPAEISGGMQKRAGLARAMALDPEILFVDEPSAGLDPLSSSRLDDLIVELRDSLGATVVIVSHELPSIFGIGTNCVFLDAETKTMLAAGDPRDLRDHSEHPTVRRFLTRGEFDE
jgi:phospholipid/cholesterol/gamma-HCH transport system ATP-binding protein